MFSSILLLSLAKLFIYHSVNLYVICIHFKDLYQNSSLRNTQGRFSLFNTGHQRHQFTKQKSAVEGVYISSHSLQGQEPKLIDKLFLGPHSSGLNSSPSAVTDTPHKGTKSNSLKGWGWGEQQNFTKLLEKSIKTHQDSV